MRQPRSLNRKPQGSWDTTGDDDTNTLVTKDLEMGDRYADDGDSPDPSRFMKAAIPRVSRRAFDDTESPMRKRERRLKVR